MSNKEYFSNEYLPQSSTSAPQPTIKLDDDKKDLDTSKYGLNKPRRVIIKAKLIDDKNG